MEQNIIKKILEDTAFVHVSGTPEELKVAEYLKAACEERGVPAAIETFEVPGSDIEHSRLLADGVEIPANPYNCSGNADIEAPLFYLANHDPASIAQVKGKIVLMTDWLDFYTYRDVAEAGAAGFIVSSGNIFYPEDEPDRRILRERFFEGKDVVIPGMQISAKQAVKLVQAAPETIRMEIRETPKAMTYHNVVAEIPGKRDEWIVCTAHYDTTALSVGSYDNMTGCITLLEILEKLSASAPNNYGVRIIFCGGEESGLLGSKAYLEQHEDQIEKIALNINIDMIGSIMGGFLACVSAEDALAHHIKYLASEAGWGIKVECDVYSSDSTSFADKGIPALTFARMPSGNYFSIHTRHDTMELLSLSQIQKDIAYVADFADRMANAVQCPVKREIPEKIKKSLDEYLGRKHPED